MPPVRLALAVLSLPASILVRCATAADNPADAIFHGGEIVTVDARFSRADAMAVRDGRILAVGTFADVRRHDRPGHTALHDLEGRMVLPGLIDSHVHAAAAAVTELDHEVPAMETIAEVLAYFTARARAVPAGEWIWLQQVFITRLREERFPTREELDRASPDHPAAFRTGPDAMLNSAALRQLGFDRDFRVADGGSGHLERDANGNPTGLTRGLLRLMRPPTADHLAEEEHLRRLRSLFASYHAIGITAVGERGANEASTARYATLRDRGELDVRVALSHIIPVVGSPDASFRVIDRLATSPLRRDDGWLRLNGTKIWLDGGMLTGSAYMLEPWGRSEMYGIDDDTYRGVRNVAPELLDRLVERAAGHGLQFTAHAVGDAAVTDLLDSYERVHRRVPLDGLRLGLTHSNFMTADAIGTAARLGVVVDVQPVWLYLDSRTLLKQFGPDRLRYFQPLRSLAEAGVVAGGGSDHMMKRGDLRSINPYNPFLGMWTTLTRRGRWHDQTVHESEALTREQAIRLYTSNNAHLLFWENEIGSLEAGKRADFIVIDRDLLTCPVDDIRTTRVLETWIEGRQVFRRNDP